jgi:uncharacterized membrane protein YfcA
MKSRPAMAALFLFAAAYDGTLGLAFLVAHGTIFQWFKVTPPNHPGYIQFSGALLIVFAIMFAAIARNPQGNRNLIPYGILLKVSYCGVAFWHWSQGGIPNMWKPWAIADLVFLVLFYAAYRQLGKEPRQEAARAN